MTAHTTAREVRRALDDVDFPADKSDILASAQRSNASEEVLGALRALPREEYRNRDDVVHSVRLDPDSDVTLTPGQQGEQARLGGKHGLSQHLRDAPKPPIDEELDR